MRSTINVSSYVGTDRGVPDIVYSTCIDIVSQWEIISGRGADFTLWYDETLFGLYETQEVKGSPAPSMSGSIEFGIQHYYNRVDFWTEVTNFTDRKEVQDLNDKLGIEDIFNLKPHEKGLLRLKHNLHGAWLFFPTQVLDLVKQQEGE